MTISWIFLLLLFLLFLKYFIYLFLEKREWRDKERERNIDVREKHQLVVSLTLPDQGPNVQPRHVPWPGIKPVTFLYAGWCPTNWATPVRAVVSCNPRLSFINWIIWNCSYSTLFNLYEFVSWRPTQSFKLLCLFFMHFYFAILFSVGPFIKWMVYIFWMCLFI